MSSSAKDTTEKTQKPKEKKNQQNESQLNDLKQIKSSSTSNQSKDSLKKQSKQQETTNQQLANENIKLKPTSNPQATISQINNKEFTTAQDTIQLKKGSKGFKLFNHLQYQCDYSIIEKLP